MAGSGDRRTRSERLQSWLPGTYLLLTVATAVVALPTILRPPPPEQSASAEFSPDAPPDQDSPDSIISSLQAASSRTAGATAESDGPGESTVTPTSIVRQASRGLCIGNPARQIESVYSPPCRPAFVGDNGGATWKGVTENEIRIGVAYDLQASGNEGPMEESGNASERTFYYMGQYFAKHLELYGRRVRMFNAEDGDSNEAQNRARATRLDKEYDVFGAITQYSWAVNDELARRRIPTMTSGQASDPVHAGWNDYVWASPFTSSDAARIGAEWMCKRVVPYPPYKTGDPTVDMAEKRVYGVLLQRARLSTHAADLFMELLEKQCNFEAAEVISYVAFTDAEQLGTAIARFRQKGVTSIVYFADFFTAIQFSHLADDQAYFPEWILPAYGGFDASMFITRAVSQNQWRNAFGISLYEIPLKPRATECYRAIRTFAPGFDPARGVCELAWPQMINMFGAIQEAGPDLNPDTWKKGLWSLPERRPDPIWSLAGKFGPGDWGYNNWAAELYYSPTATHSDGDKGAYLFPNGARRYRFGDIPVGRPSFFQGGTNGADLEG